MESDNPTIKKILYSPAAITIQFPSGDMWEYVLYDDNLLRDLLFRHRRNVGRLVATLKRLKVEASKVYC